MQLHDGHATLALDRLCQAVEAGAVAVVPGAELAGKPLADFLNVCGTGHSQAKTPFRTHGQPVELFF